MKTLTSQKVHFALHLFRRPKQRFSVDGENEAQSLSVIQFTCLNMINKLQSVTYLVVITVIRFKGLNANDYFIFATITETG